MTEKEHPNIEKEDWRLQAITTLAKKFKSPFSGTTHPVGQTVKAITQLKRDSKIIFFGIPSASALFLSLSNRLGKEAKEELKKPIFKPLPNKTQTYFVKDQEIFNIYENLMATVVFAFTALEAFANEAIPKNYVYTFKIKKDRKYCIEKYNKSQIERFISLDIKLSKILPHIFKINSPKGTNIWKKYTELKTIRDRIIHLKDMDRENFRPDQPFPDSIWNQLLKKEIPNMALTAREIIKYFEQGNPPRWLRKCPF